MPDPAADDIELIEREGYLEARYLGAFSIERYFRQMEQSVQACKDRNLKLLLVDVADLTGYRPTTLERHQIGTRGASLSRGLDKVAALGMPGQVTADQFATQVAQNRGLRIQVFTDRAQAIEWLLAGKPKGR